MQQSSAGLQAQHQHQQNGVAHPPPPSSSTTTTTTTTSSSSSASVSSEPRRVSSSKSASDLATARAHSDELDSAREEAAAAMAELREVGSLSFLRCGVRERRSKSGS